jgi:hypothetical protein
MPCSPEDISVNPPALQGSDANLGEVSSTFDFGLGTPGGFPPDLSKIFDTISAILPSGTIKPHLNTNIDHSVFDAVMDLLNKILPFLSIYKFFMPILNIVVCIIEVLCAIPNPFKLIRAIRRLFRNCLPDFLGLFPIFALIAMIISLILIIVALIEYLVSEIIFVVAQLVENINLLAKVIKRNDLRGALAIQQKIGSHLCYLQNLFVIFGVLGVIFQVIKSLFNFPTSFPPCDDGDTSEFGCCTPEVCPAFIRDQEEFTGTVGTLQYFNEVAIDSGSGFFSTIRNPSWQFYDPTLSNTKSFINIIKPFDIDPALGFTFFPQGIVYDASTNVRKVPYTVDMRFKYNPVAFGRHDPKGSRFVRINNCIVNRMPTENAVGYNGNTTPPTTGVLSLVGGIVFEDDGSTPVLIGGAIASLNSLVHFDAIHGSVVTIAGGAKITNIEYTFKINHEVLLEHTMITLGCVPSVALDRGLINGGFGHGGSISQIEFPDPEATRVCLTAALDSIRSDISLAKLADFQSFTTSCLNGLKIQSLTALQGLIGVGFNANTSKFMVSPSIQFTTFPVKVAVTLNDVNGINLCTKLPAETVAAIQDKISAVINFGEISGFVYNTTDFTFEAYITSKKEGGGKIKIMYDNSFIRTTTVPANLNVPATTVISELTYQFVATSTLVATTEGAIVDGVENAGEVVRDDGDTAREGTE